jgi:transposase
MDKRTYSEAEKLQVVKEALEVENASMVARRHDIHPSLVTRWVSQYRAFGGAAFASRKAGTPNGEPLLGRKAVKGILLENERLKRLLGEKELENEILRDLVKKGSLR